MQSNTRLLSPWKILRGLIWGFILFSLSQKVSDGQFVKSDWGTGSGSLAVRVTAPSFVEISRQDKDFYVKCELKNIGTDTLTVTQRARIFLVNQAGETTKCLRHNGGVYEHPNLAPGESTIWWQNGQAITNGPFKLYVSVDGNDPLQSPTVPVVLRRSTVVEEDLPERRTEQVQSHSGKFSEVVPNTAEDKISYTEINLTKDPFVIDGHLYSGFSFVVPKSGHALALSFVIKDQDHNGMSWGLVPAEGSAVQLPDFEWQKLTQAMADVGEAGDSVIYHIMDSSELTPGQRCFFWLMCPHRDIPSIRISVNFLEKIDKSTGRLFHPQDYLEGKDRMKHEPKIPGPP